MTLHADDSDSDRVRASLDVRVRACVSARALFASARLRWHLLGCARPRIACRASVSRRRDRRDLVGPRPRSQQNASSTRTGIRAPVLCFRVGRLALGQTGSTRRSRGRTRDDNRYTIRVCPTVPFQAAWLDGPATPAGPGRCVDSSGRSRSPMLSEPDGHRLTCPHRSRSADGSTGLVDSARASA